MDAGRELDALVAEKVMGWRHVTPPVIGDIEPAKRFMVDPYMGVMRWVLARTDPEYWQLAEWHPSTDIAAAWLVIEHMRAQGWSYRIGNTVDNRHYAVFDRGEYDVGITGWPEEHIGQAASAPLAICQAALKAVEA